VTDQATPTPANTTPAATPASAPTAGGPAAPKVTYTWGTGRRKTAIARVRIKPGSGTFTINKRELKAYFPLEGLRVVCQAPLKATENVGKFDVFVNVSGGGLSGQAGAVSLGLARALLRYDSAFEPPLRDGKYLTRDSREVERKKYGKAGARRSFQWTKR
jgi:small subunit ribosomal protein S9